MFLPIFVTFWDAPNPVFLRPVFKGSTGKVLFRSKIQSKVSSLLKQLCMQKQLSIDTIETWGHENRIIVNLSQFGRFEPSSKRWSHELKATNTRNSKIQNCILRVIRTTNNNRIEWSYRAINTCAVVPSCWHLNQNAKDILDATLNMISKEKQKSQYR